MADYKKKFFALKAAHASAQKQHKDIQKKHTTIQKRYKITKVGFVATALVAGAFCFLIHFSPDTF